MKVLMKRLVKSALLAVAATVLSGAGLQAGPETKTMGIGDGYRFKEASDCSSYLRELEDWSTTQLQESIIALGAVAIPTGGLGVLFDATFLNLISFQSSQSIDVRGFCGSFARDISVHRKVVERAHKLLAIINVANYGIGASEEDQKIFKDFYHKLQKDFSAKNAAAATTTVGAATATAGYSELGEESLFVNHAPKNVPKIGDLADLIRRASESKVLCGEEILGEMVRSNSFKPLRSKILSGELEHETQVQMRAQTH